MVVHLRSNTLRIDGGTAVICDAATPWREDLLAQQTGYCSENQIRDMEIRSPGRYLLWLGGPTAEVVNTGTRSTFEMITPWTLDISQEDLQAGEVTFSLPFEQLFLVKVTRAGVPVPRHPLYFYDEWGGAEITCQVRTDTDGTVVILQPGHLRETEHPMPLDDQDVTVTVEILR